MGRFITIDFGKFDSRERMIAENILKAWRKHGLPEDFESKGVVIMMDKNSGDMFLTNDESQISMLIEEKLESFYSCWQCGFEGFLKDFENNATNECCKEHLKDLK